MVQLNCRNVIGAYFIMVTILGIHSEYHYTMIWPLLDMLKIKEDLFINVGSIIAYNEPA